MGCRREIQMSAYSPDRDSEIIKYCKGKKVLHIGAADWPYTRLKLESGTLLYKRIDDVANNQLGIDISVDGVKLLKNHKFKSSEIITIDMNNLQTIDYSPDVILFCETLEHLMNLEIALSNLKRIMNKDTMLIISVPNANRFFSIFYPIFGYEPQHPDHKVAFTYKTLTQLLRANGLLIEDLKFTWLSGSSKDLNWKGKVELYISRPISRIFPMYAGTLLVFAKLNLKN